MNIKRIGILLFKDIKQSFKSFFFFQAVFTPIVCSLFISLLFGTLLVSHPKVGIFDKGNSRIVQLFSEHEYIITTEYDSLEKLKKNVAAGVVDLGIAIPADFDEKAAQHSQTEMELYFYGESFIKDQAAIWTRLMDSIFELENIEKLVTIERVVLGSGKNKSWNERLMPLVILLAIMMAGLLLPSTSLIEEKQKKTLTALTTTPTTLLEVILSKGLLGFTISMIIAFTVLAMNNMIRIQTLLLVCVLALGAVLSSVIGLFFGALSKDINTLMTIVKSIMLLFYAPGILKIFPEIPDWVGRIFPTYYILEPVIAITNKNAGFYDIALDFFILAGLIVCLTCILVAVVNRRMRVAV